VEILGDTPTPVTKLTTVSFPGIYTILIYPDLLIYAEVGITLIPHLTVRADTHLPELLPEFPQNPFSGEV
jgi:hypothetical protein